MFAYFLTCFQNFLKKLQLHTTVIQNSQIEIINKQKQKSILKTTWAAISYVLEKRTYQTPWSSFKC